jgi:hypothetical protein
LPDFDYTLVLPKLSSLLQIPEDNMDLINEILKGNSINNQTLVQKKKKLYGNPNSYIPFLYYNKNTNEKYVNI